MRLLLSLLCLCLLPASATAREGKDDGGGGAGAKGDEAEFEVLKSPFHALEEACVIDGDAQACLEAGTGWREGTDDQKPDREQAVNLFAAGCRFGSVDACELAAEMYLRMEAGMMLVRAFALATISIGGIGIHPSLARDRKSVV